MSSGLTDDDRRRIESFCETPPYDRSPEDLTPEREYADQKEGSRGEASDSLPSQIFGRLQSRW
jgi:hypothetical protein